MPMQRAKICDRCVSNRFSRRLTVTSQYDYNEIQYLSYFIRVNDRFKCIFYSFVDKTLPTYIYRLPQNFRKMF